MSRKNLQAAQGTQTGLVPGEELHPNIVLQVGPTRCTSPRHLHSHLALSAFPAALHPPLSLGWNIRLARHGDIHIYASHQVEQVPNSTQALRLLTVT